MKTSMLVGILMLVLLPGGLQNPLPPGSVEGIVRNAETREPIADVEVSLLEGFNATPLTVRTDITGDFILNNVAPNTYTVMRRRFGLKYPKMHKERTSDHAQYCSSAPCPSIDARENLSGCP
jgi:hypothetical protein